MNFFKNNFKFCYERVWCASCYTRIGITYLIYYLYDSNYNAEESDLYKRDKVLVLQQHCIVFFNGSIFFYASIDLKCQGLNDNFLPGL